MADLLTPNNDHTNKRFWTYIKEKETSNAELRTSFVKNHHTFSDNISKANILNNQFSPVFTMDDDCSTMFDGHPYPDIPAIQINTLRVLHDLDPHKAPDPDGISPKLLKETSI